MSCEHESCHCQSEVDVVREGGTRYCSEYCANAKDSDGSCECGHAGCSTAEVEAEPATPGM
jgi:hypothetical protein